MNGWELELEDFLISNRNVTAAAGVVRNQRVLANLLKQTAPFNESANICIIQFAIHFIMIYLGKLC
jgi:hypothetical protein